MIANDAVDSADHGNELEQLRQLERQHRKQFDALLSVVEKQQEQIETLNSRLSKLDPDVDDMHARHLSTVDNLTAYSGLQVKKEKSMVALGPEADIKMLRTDFGTLEILAETVLVHGVLEVKDLVVNGTSITDLITPPPPVYNMTVNVLTASVTSSESTSTFLVEFFVGGTGWTDPVEFFSGTSKDEIHVKSFAVSGKPSKIRFSIDGNDAWGIAQAAVAFNDDPEMVVLCSTVLGATPALGNNGHWSAYVSVMRRYDLVHACSSGYLCVCVFPCAQGGWRLDCACISCLRFGASLCVVRLHYRRNRYATRNTLATHPTLGLTVVNLPLRSPHQFGFRRNDISQLLCQRILDQSRNLLFCIIHRVRRLRWLLANAADISL